MKENNINSINDLYDYNTLDKKNILDNYDTKMAGWEDVLLSYSKKSQMKHRSKKK